MLPEMMRCNRPDEVLLVTGANPLRGGGGLETYVRAHALAAQATGRTAHVFCLSHRTRVSTTPFGVIHEVGVPPHMVSGAFARLYSPMLERALRRHLAGTNSVGPVLLHAFGPYSIVGARLCRTLCEEQRASALVTSVYNTQASDHGPILAGWRPEHGILNGLNYLSRYAAARTIGTRYERLGYDASRLLLVNYESVRTLLQAQFGARWEIRNVPYASDAAFQTYGEDDTPEPAPVPASNGVPLLVCLSRHDARKGIDVLLRALAELQADGISFRACLIGRGELTDAHRRLATRLGLDDRVSIPGQVPDVRPYLRQAEVFVLPSLSESSGSLSLLEALQAGVPIVTTSCDGMPEDVTDGDSALLVPPGVVRSLAHALAQLLENEPLRRRLGARGRAVYESRFSADVFAASLDAVYDELELTASH
jgi:glycosyltransferase involved in cell wall biosynthesis